MYIVLSFVIRLFVSIEYLNDGIVCTALEQAGKTSEVTDIIGQTTQTSLSQNAVRRRGMKERQVDDVTDHVTFDLIIRLRSADYI